MPLIGVMEFSSRGFICSISSYAVHTGKFLRARMTFWSHSRSSKITHGAYVENTLLPFSSVLRRTYWSKIANLYTPVPSPVFVVDHPICNSQLYVLFPEKSMLGLWDNESISRIRQDIIPDRDRGAQPEYTLWQRSSHSNEVRFLLMICTIFMCQLFVQY